LSSPRNHEIPLKKLIPHVIGYIEPLEKSIEEQTIALIKSEAKQQAILNAIGDLITIQNKDLDIIWINQPERVIYGNVIGQKCYRVYKGLESPCPNCTVKKVFEEKKTVISEGMVLRPDGSPIYILTTSSPVRDPDGKIVAVVEVVKDITKYKLTEEALKESEEKYSTIVEKGNDGICIVQDKLVKYVNLKMVQLTGFSIDETLGKQFIDCIAPEYRELILERHKRQISGEKVLTRYEMEILKKDGKKTPVEVNVSLIDYEGRPAVMAIIRDITERQKVDQMKSQFINTAAHELRTPLSALKVNVDLLDLKSKNIDLPKAIRSRIEIIADSAERLTVLVNNFLDYTRLEAGTKKLELELGSLERVVVQTIKDVLPLARKHGHMIDLITPEPLPLIYMDIITMRTILNNLVSNAIKYTPDGGKITITLMKEEEKVHVTVKDTGIGIMKKDLDKIFQPFHVVDLPASVSFQSKYERTGLGLAITKEYVKMHDGSIWAESRIGEGSTFHVVLPITKTH
jgi:PAS domain S-box-containing protein